MENKDRILEILDTISKDMKNDMKLLEGSSFNAKIVGTAFGNLAAAIDGLAKILHKVVKELK